MKATIGICYQITTHESADAGEFADQGYEEDPRPFEAGDLKHVARRYGPFMRLADTGSDYWISYDTENYRTGARTCYSVHIDNITSATRARIDRALANR